MGLSRVNQNASLSSPAPKGSPAFGRLGSKIPLSLDELKAIKQIADCKAANLVTDITKRIPLKHLVQKGTAADGVFLPKDVSKWRKLLESFVDIARMPRGLAASILQNLRAKFPKNGFIENLYNRPFIQKQIKITELKDNLGTLKGIYENGAEFLHKAKSGKAICKYGISENACESVSNGFDKLLNSAMGWGKSKYDTKHERFWTRIVSGFVAANFLGRDFFNKAKMNDKNDKEAKQSAHGKINQERLATAGEAISQFAFLAAFGQLANTKSWAPPLISALIGLAFNVISRLALGRRITRVKVPSNEVRFDTTPQIEDFVQDAKDKKEPENINVPSREKKRLLTLKNILIAIGTSIALGFVLKAGKRTKVFKNLEQAFYETRLGKWANKLKSNAFEDVIASKQELFDISDSLEKGSEKNIGISIRESLGHLGLEGKEEFYLGKSTKTTKLFGKIEVPTSKLQELPLMPLRFLKEIVMYPYKVADSFVQASAKYILEKQGVNLENINNENLKSRLSKFCAKVIDKSAPVRKADIEDIENIVLRFRSFKEKYPQTAEFDREFGAYIDNMRKASLNSVTSSKINNEKLAVPAQVLGMLSGIFFNMNDDYNQTVTLGGSKKQAEKDARLRGVNKFIRVGVQATIVGVLNALFAKYYNASVFKAALVTAGATITTDTACRVLTGMPLRKMNKDELVEHEKKKEEGISGKYFKIVDKIVS